VGTDGGGLKGFEFHPEMRQVSGCASSEMQTAIINSASCRVYGLQRDGLVVKHAMYRVLWV
jgi:hypothetical protein